MQSASRVAPPEPTEPVPRRRLDPHAFVGWLSLGALGALAATLGRVEWLDAWVTARVAALRGCAEGTSATLLTDAAPYGAALTVTLGFAYAWWRNRPRRELAVVLGAFVVSLLLVQGLKVTFERDRPGVPPFAPSGSQSFPSGHTANAGLAVAAALAATRGTGPRVRGTRAALAIAGAAWVVAIAFTRIYLNRHWATDVVAGMLAGVAFWGLATARRGPVTRALLAVTIAVVIPGLLLASATGGRIHLPAPSTLSDPGTAGATLLRRARLARAVGGEWRRPRRARAFVRLYRPGFDLTVRTRQARRAVLKVVAAPLGGLTRGGRCAWVDVSVNGRPIARRPLKPAWRVYGFALPLAAGRNDVRVVAGPATPGRPALALDALAVEGSPEAAAIDEAAAGSSPTPARGRGRRAGRS